MLNILSIDWDYFPLATGEQRCYWFPDGGNENLPLSIQDFIWQSRYAENPISDIPIDKDAIEMIRKVILKGWSVNTEVVIAESHADIHDAIEQLLRDKLDQPIEIWNVDFHHDYYGLKFDEVDCGNWVNNIFDEKTCHPVNLPEAVKKSLYHWVRREDSCDDSVPEESWFNTNPMNDLDEFTEENTFDLIYICRSGVWSPPHLDKDLNKLVRYVRELSKRKLKFIYSEGVSSRGFINRYSKGFQLNVEGTKKVTGKIIEDINRRYNGKGKTN